MINDELMIEYNHDVELGENKLKYLASLDAKFEAGLEIGGQFVADPDIQQRARYMAMSLMEGIMYNDEKMASVSVSWLATRLPDLKQVVAHADHDGTKFELIFDREYTPHVNVEFNPTLN